MDQQEKRKLAASHWDKVTQSRDTAHANLVHRWWQHPLIIQKINQRVSGQMIARFSGGLHERLRAKHLHQLPAQRAVSVGCGNGAKEMALIEQGLVQKFDLFEISEKRITQGRKRAEQKGLTNRVTFFSDDAFAVENLENTYDLVHWNNALHHMFDVFEAVEWSYRVLKPGGIFYMDDFIGPVRFQWSDEMLTLANDVRRSLPIHYFFDAHDSSQLLKRTIDRPDPDKLAAIDPSEAADSDRIIHAIQTYFTAPDIVLTGGVIYHLALRDILHNFSTVPSDDPFLNILMLLDFQAADAGLSHYAITLAQK